MRARYRCAVLAAAVLAGVVSAGGSALAAAPTAHGGAAVTAVAPRSGPPPHRWDHRPDRHGRDHGGWRGRGWDHRGYGWDWERQCEWAWRHDRLWWIQHCR
jgi:hypothetical protein